MSYLRYLCLLTYSGVHHMLCCVFALVFFVLLPVSLYVYILYHAIFSHLATHFFLNNIAIFLNHGIPCAHTSNCLARGNQKRTIQRYWQQDEENQSKNTTQHVPYAHCICRYYPDSHITHVFPNNVFIHQTKVRNVTFWVPCCDVRNDCRIKTMFGSSWPPVVCRRSHVLFT
jgi:hypothetical protein